jgi:YVTN family beta-propeller protein
MRLLSLLAVGVLAAGASPLKLSRSFPLAAVKGRIDHMSADVRGNRLFVAALGNNTVEVIDTNSGKVIRTLTGINAPQGILYIPDANRLVVASRTDGTIRFYDGTSYQLLKTVNKTSDADNLRYDPTTKSVIAGYADGFIGFFDATGKQLGEVRLEGHPESFQVDSASRRLFVNLPSSSHVVIINTDSKSIARTISTAEYAGNYAMALDQKNSRLFVVARKPPKLLILEASGGRPIEDRRTVGDVDDIFYDAARHRLYLSGGDGNIDVINQRDKDHYEPMAVVPTAPGARTSLYVPDWNKLFVAVPRAGDQPCEIRVYDVLD